MGRHSARYSCPFCEHPYTDMLAEDDNRRGKRGQRLSNGARPQLYHVVCCACGGAGPRAETKGQAATLWNARPDRRDRAGVIAPAVPLDVEGMLR